MSTINQIQLPNGSTYDFEDTAAREEASSKADKTLATASANGLMSAADKKAVDREFFRMLPKGGTHIPAKADLNTIQYLKVGNYYNPANVESITIKNIPVGNAFLMYVLSPLSEAYDNESTSQWVYRLRIFIDFTGENIFVQKVSSGSTVGNFTYGSWIKLTNSNDLSAVSKIINDHIANKNNPHAVTKAQVGLGSVANIDQSKAIKSITRSGTTFTATALDGTTTTFTQQDSNTTYGVATSSADGLMSKTDKAKLDGVAAGADVSQIKTVKVNGTALTPDSSKAVNVTVPTLANNATTTAGGMALDARMGKTLSDQISSVKAGAIDQIVNLTAAGWTGDAAPYSQTVNVTGMSSELLCELFSACSKSATVAERKAYNKAYAIVASGYAETADGKVTFYADKKPAIDIGVRIKSISKANAVSTQTSSDISNAVDAMSNTLGLTKLYPVGSIYLSVNDTDPGTFIGGTWELVGSGKTLWGADASHAAGTTIDAGLPNMTGWLQFSAGGYGADNSKLGGAFYADGYYADGTNGYAGGSGNGTLYQGLHIDASRSNAIYGNSSTVQPPAYVVYIWKRTA